MSCPERGRQLAFRPRTWKGVDVGVLEAIVGVTGRLSLPLACSNFRSMCSAPAGAVGASGAEDGVGLRRWE